ncbi:MAG: MATE family efflux transporter [Eubacterium sp.]|nr:MATE family efflux transporter [Eubacterium sp.]MCM1214661.1 MATE family efflux transporter [Lachnospiraceae bacterium]MCM1215593.1 MATE family efflux transporter [Lachnospiraceae bacterium]MCM1238535.1 MATE family efflux transporter [Lachnospiraceae bacterium]
MAHSTDFSKGKVWQNIVAQSIPLILAQLVQLLYNVVDRIYIGHLPGADSMALTGIGLVFPLTTLIAAFTFLFGTGGTPLFSIARGAGEEARAEKILGNTFSLLLGTSLVLLIFCYLFRRPVLYLFGASDDSYVYADAYLRIYLLGTSFTMLTTGLNGFINAQGFPRIGMLTTLLGAALNLVLDPVFIFGLDMGVGGAALATVLSQTVSCVWVLRFLTGKKALLRIRKRNLRVDWQLIREIVTLGLSGFIMQGTNCLVQVVCNATLKIYGGDLYVGIMTVINSAREILSLPVNGITSGAQPVLGYNYGAKQYDKVRQGIRFTAALGIVYTLLAWLLVFLSPHLMLSVFTEDTAMIEAGVGALRLYFFGFFFMAFQFTGQSAFTALGYSRHAIFFSLLRKAVIVAPLTILLPRLGLGVDGVFLAEPISNAIGGLACFVTMYFALYRRLKTESL